MMSGMINPKQRSSGLMEDLAEILRAEVLPTYLPLVQLIHKICEDPTLKQVDLYSKYTRLAAVVGGDWINVKEELLIATGFGAPALYCSISAMLAVFTCRCSRSHDELVSSLTELYNHISAGNEALNKQVEYAIKTMGRQMELANVAEVSIANLNERVDIALTTIDRQMEHVSTAETRIATIVERADNVTTTMEKQVEQVNKAKESITNVIERADNVVTKIEKHEELVKRAEASIINVIERADNATTKMEQQVKQVDKAKASITNVIERADNVVTKIEKQEELVKRAEASITNVIKRADNATTMVEKGNKASIANIDERADNDNKSIGKNINIAETKNPSSTKISETRQHNKDVVAIQTATFRCKYGTLTINDQSQCTFTGSSSEAKILALWFTLPVSQTDLKILMNLDHEELIETIELNPILLNDFNNLTRVQRRGFLDYFFAVIKNTTEQWY